MHEMALTRDVVDIVVGEAEKAGAQRVDAVYLTIGYARDIVDELFEKCFAYLARGTVAQGAELVLERTPLMVSCDACGMVYHLDVFGARVHSCPCCGARGYTLRSGYEFSIDRIEAA